MKDRLRWKSRWVYALFFVLVIAFFFDIIFLGKVFLLRDTFADFIPKLSFARRAYHAGVVPLWNPLTGCGHPFLADPYTGAAYPLNVLFYILPMTVAHKVSLVMHLTLAGWGIVALARLWGFGIAPALLSAVGFAFSTYVVAVAEFFNILFPVCWGPVILYLGCLLYRRVETLPAGVPVARAVLANWALITALAVCLACNYLAGNPQYLVFAIALVSAYHLARCIHRREARVAALSYGLFLGAGGIALLLCMPQILPFLELLGQSYRSTGIDPESARASVHPSHFLTLVFPFLFGKGSMFHGYWGKSMLEYWLAAFYVGVAPLLTVAYAFRGFRRDKSRESDEMRHARFLCLFFTASLVVGVALASGQYLPVYKLVTDFVPGFDKVRWPSRFMLVWVYFVPLAAGLGMHLLAREKETQGQGKLPRWFWVAPGAGGLLALFLWAGYLAGGDMRGLFRFLVGGGANVPPEGLPMFRRDWMTAALFLTTSVVALWFLLRSRKQAVAQAAQFAIVGIAFCNLALIGRQVHAMSAEDVYSHEPAIWQTIGAELASHPHQRIYTKYGMNQFNLYEAHDPEVYKLAKTVGVGETWLQSDIQRAWRSSLALDRYNRIYNTMMFAQDAAVLLRFADLLNVGMLMIGPDWPDLVRNGGEGTMLRRQPNAVPRAYLVKSWRRVSGYEDGLRVLLNLGFDMHREVLIEDGEGGEVVSLPMNPGPAVSGSVRKLEYGWSEAVLEVEAAENCLLVLVDSWYPDWKAWIDGVETPIFKANLLFRAVELPAGSTRVVFRYAPVRWKIGLGLFALGIAAIAAGFFAARKLAGRGETQASRQ